MSRIKLTRTVLENSTLSERQLRDLISGSPPPPNQRRSRNSNLNVMTRPLLVDLLLHTEIEYRPDAIARDVYSELTDAEKVLSALWKAKLILLQDDNDSSDELTDDENVPTHGNEGNSDQNPQLDNEAALSESNLLPNNHHDDQPILPVNQGRGNGDQNSQPDHEAALSELNPLSNIDQPANQGVPEAMKLQVYLSLRDQKSEYKLAQSLRVEFPVPYIDGETIEVQHDVVIYAIETCIKNSPSWISDAETVTVFDNQTNVLHLQSGAYKHLQGGLVRCASICTEECCGAVSFTPDFGTLTQVVLPHGAFSYTWWSSEEYAKFFATRTPSSTKTSPTFRIDLCLARSISHAFHDISEEDRRPTKKPRRHLRNSEVKQKAAQDRHSTGTTLIRTMYEGNPNYEDIILSFADKTRTYDYLITFRWATWFYTAWCDTTDDDEDKSKPLEMTVWQGVLRHQADGWLTPLAKSGQIIHKKGGSSAVLSSKGSILESKLKGKNRHKVSPKALFEALCDIYNISCTGYKLVPVSE